MFSSEWLGIGGEISEWWSETYNYSYGTKISIILKEIKSNMIEAGSLTLSFLKSAVFWLKSENFGWFFFFLIIN